MKYFFLLLALLITGCSSGEFRLAEVSGTVNMDGKPLAGVEVIYAPMETEGVIEVGPISIATTDAEGKYTLKTVKGVSGAVVTNHRVSIGFPELDEAAVAAKVDEAYAKDRNMPESQVMALERKIRKSMTNRESIPESYNKKTILRIEIKGRNETADFELNSEGT